MKRSHSLYSTLVSVLLFISIQTVNAQASFPLDSVENLVIYSGIKNIKACSKKKSVNTIKTWAGERLVFPPMVFSIIHESKDRMVLKALTEVPGPKGLHPISFKLDIMVTRKYFDYRADYFYFEDINLSLEEWLDKYGTSDVDRHIKTVEMIEKGLSSHVFLSLEDLKNQINKQ